MGPRGAASRRETGVTPMNPGHIPPSLPPTHYLDNRIFTDPAIFRAEQENIFAKTW